MAALWIASVVLLAAPLAPKGASVAAAPDVRASAVTPSIWYNYSDFFNVPFGEWWDMRSNAGYGDEPVGASCFNQTAVNDVTCTTNVPGINRVLAYPYIDWLGPSTTATIYTPFRAHIDAFNQPGYNLSQPVFLPVTNYNAPPGNLLTFNWNMQYLDKANYTLLTSTRSCYQASGANANDGYQLWNRIYLTLDNQEAARIFGATVGTQTQIQNWWASNTAAGCANTKQQEGPVEVAVDDWFTGMANGKYDIYNGYDGGYISLFTNVTATVVSGGATGTTHVAIEHGAWGTEAFLDRLFYWGNASYAANAGNSAAARGWWGMENGWWDDFHYAGKLSSTGLNFTLNSVMQYLFQERSMPGPDSAFRSSTNLGDTDDFPVWTWGPMLLDYVIKPNHPNEVLRYSGVNYIKTTPGSGDYGTNTTFDYTPISWAAKANEWWNFHFPTTSAAFFQNPATAAIPTNMPTTQLPPISTSLAFLNVFPSMYGTWDAGTGTWAVTGGTSESWPPGTSGGGYPYIPYPGIYFKPAVVPPTVTTSQPSSITTSGATLNGDLTNLGSAQSVTVGFLYGTDPNLATSPSNTTPITRTATGTFSQAVTGLSPTTQYYVQAWALGQGFSKGGIVPFATTGTPPTVTTGAASSITTTGATLGGATTNLGTATSVEVGFLYGTDQNLAINPGNVTATTQTSPAAFSKSVSGLAAGTTYYFQAWALGDGWATGTITSFATTTSATAPTVTTNAVGTITTTGATLNGDLTNLGTATTVTVGFIYGTDPTLATNTNTTGVPETAVTTFSDSVTGLSPGTVYYVQAWANGNGFAFGAPVSFKTTSTPPTVATSAASSIATDGAMLNGDLTDLGTATTVTVGFIYGTDPTLATNTNTTGVPETAVTTFSQAVTGLTPGTTYYFQAWANGQGFASGSIENFKTAVTPPLVNTGAATSVTVSSVVLNGATTNLGTASSVEVGFLYSTDALLASPTNVSAGPQTVPGGFSSAVGGLTGGTTYYYEAWADGDGFATGSIQSFATLAPPAVTTNAASSVTTTAATLNGDLTALGTATSVEVGFYWGTDPVLASATNVSATSLTAPGTFTTALASLTPGTRYYFRAWAKGDSFVNGSILNFAAGVTPPTVITNAASGIGNTAATLNGDLTSLGTATTVTVGFLWGTDANLVGATNDTVGPETATGAFTDAITGLTPGTTYHFRAWANGHRFVSGAILAFTTTTTAPAVTTNAASGITAATATLNGATSSLGTASPVTVGFLWGTSQSLAGATNVTVTSQTAAGAFTRSLTGLSASTTYYFAAWANGHGYVQGTTLSFVTLAAAAPPSVTTAAPSGVISTGATLNGNLAGLGTSSTVTVGFLWGTDANLAGATNTSVGPLTATGTFTAAIANLAPGTTYYVEAWAMGDGFAHGSIQSFTTPAAPSEPTFLGMPALIGYAVLAVIILVAVAVVVVFFLMRRKKQAPPPPESP